MPHQRFHACTAARMAVIAASLLLAIANITLAQVQVAGLSGLDAALQAEPLSLLAEHARTQGDAQRGAVVFYQPYLACRKCHSVTGTSPLGPVLSQLKPAPTDEQLVEAVLFPSRTIRKGFEPVTVVTLDGKAINGLKVTSPDNPESGDAIIVQEGRPDGGRITIPRTDIEEVVAGTTSIMPAGQMNQLTSRQQFLDLIRYLMEIRDGGPLKAAELEPPPALYALQLPEYESHVDHAGIITSLDDASLERGEAIYSRLCINCHGTHDQPGSLPTSLKFASGTFRNGRDPYTMYQTLTRGFGLMAAQTWMVPQQKYDVIHYIREKYLRSHNPSQYFVVDRQWLQTLPPGDTRGPEPREFSPWSDMDYGPWLVNTYESGNDASNFAYKGIAARLDSGPGGVSRGRAWMIFDHDTLRVSSAWTGQGFINWQGIHFDGRHGTHPRLVGTQQFGNDTGPGWANPADGSFNDPRLRGRDDRAYGPLPREWAHYKGLFRRGDRVIVNYTVGDTSVLESLDQTGTVDQPVFLRRFEIGPRHRDMTLQVAFDADHPATITQQSDDGSTVTYSPGPQRTPVTADDVAFDGSTFVEVPGAAAFNMETRDFTIAARIKTRSGGTILSRTQDAQRWMPNGQTLFVRGGKLAFDIGWVGAVTSRRSVNDGRPHHVAMTWNAETSQVSLYIDGQRDATGRLAVKDALQDAIIRLGYTNENFPAPQSFFDGTLQDVQCYQRVLAAKELASLAKAESGSPIGDGPLAHWRLTGSEDELARNQSSDTLHGQIRHGRTAAEELAPLLCGVQPATLPVTWRTDDRGALLLTIPAGDGTLRFTLWQSRLSSTDAVDTAKEPQDAVSIAIAEPDRSLSAATHGSTSLWPEKVTTTVTTTDNGGPFAIDVLTPPETNPWLARVRLTGLDFYPDGDRMAVCAWDGDVYLVTGLKALNGDPSEPAKLTWQRIASGLFQPLGLKIVDGRIYVTCRDQIVILHDLNGDGETDYYENFNNDHQVTDHFHEFAMGLQVGDNGSFYYAKSARHALTALVPHHGTLLKVTPDGSKTEIVANGFRAANGVCLNPDGTFIVTDQEGHWNPKNRINWVKPGGFYGNMFGYHDVTDSSDSAMEQPLCWITNAFDRSPAELLWVDSEKWGPLNRSLLNLSYGYGKVFVVPHETVDSQIQGGMCELPIPQFPTGLARGRFHSTDGQLYVCGMVAWGSSQQAPGGLYRIRYTGRPVHLPVGLAATERGMQLKFSGPLARAAAEDVSNYRVTVWSLVRSANYGSKHHDEHELPVKRATVSDDGLTVTLEMPDVAPTWCMEIRYALEGSLGEPVDGVIHNTIHRLREGS